MFKNQKSKFQTNQTWKIRTGFQNLNAHEDVYPRALTIPNEAVGFSCVSGQRLLFSAQHLHQSNLNVSNSIRWSIDFRYFPTVDRNNFIPEQRQAAEFVHNKMRRGGKEPLVVLTKGHKPSWEEWDTANRLGSCLHSVVQ